MQVFLANLLALLAKTILESLLARRDLLQRGHAEALADASANWVLALKWEVGAAARPDGGVGVIGLRPGAHGLRVSGRDADPDGSADADHLP